MQLANHIDGAMLADPDLSDADLTELGITLRLHRRRIMTLVRAAVQSGVKVSWDDTIHFSTQLAEDDDAEEVAMASSTSQLAIGAADLVDHHPAPRPTGKPSKQQTTFAPASGPFAARGGESGAEKSTGAAGHRRDAQLAGRGKVTPSPPPKVQAHSSGGFPVAPNIKKLPAPKVRSPPPPQAEWAALGSPVPKSENKPQWSGNVESDDDSDEDFPADFEAEDGGESVTQLL